MRTAAKGITKVSSIHLVCSEIGASNNWYQRIQHDFLNEFSNTLPTSSFPPTTHHQVSQKKNPQRSVQNMKGDTLSIFIEANRFPPAINERRYSILRAETDATAERMLIIANKNNRLPKASHSYENSDMIRRTGNPIYELEANEIVALNQSTSRSIELPILPSRSHRHQVLFRISSSLLLRLTLSLQLPCLLGHRLTTCLLSLLQHRLILTKRSMSLTLPATMVPKSSKTDRL
jgi:hypothetical protein